MVIDIMSEFINYWFMGLTFVLLVFAILLIILEPKGDKSFGLLFIILVLFVISAYIDPLQKYNNANKNIDIYKHQKDLECKSSTQIFSSQKYLINENNWKLKEFYFTNKDGLIIRADNCKEI